MLDVRPNRCASPISGAAPSGRSSISSRTSKSKFVVKLKISRRLLKECAKASRPLARVRTTPAAAVCRRCRRTMWNNNNNNSTWSTVYFRRHRRARIVQKFGRISVRGGKCAPITERVRAAQCTQRLHAGDCAEERVRNGARSAENEWRDNPTDERQPVYNNRNWCSDMTIYYYVVRKWVENLIKRVREKTRRGSKKNAGEGKPARRFVFPSSPPPFSFTLPISLAHRLGPTCQSFVNRSFLRAHAIFYACMYAFSRVGRSRGRASVSDVEIPVSHKRKNSATTSRTLRVRIIL